MLSNVMAKMGAAGGIWPSHSEAVKSFVEATLEETGVALPAPWDVVVSNLVRIESAGKGKLFNYSPWSALKNGCASPHMLLGARLAFACHVCCTMGKVGFAFNTVPPDGTSVTPLPPRAATYVSDLQAPRSPAKRSQWCE